MFELPDGLKASWGLLILAHELRAFVQQQSRCVKVRYTTHTILMASNSQVEVIVMLAGIDLLKGIEDFFVDPFLGPLDESA